MMNQLWSINSRHNNATATATEKYKSSIMAKGRQGFMLEGWKFGVYLLIPITASIYYNSPINQKKAADYWQYVTYPANPSTGWKEHIETAASQHKQRQVYREQLQQLNTTTSSASSRSAEETGVKPTTTSTQQERGWFRWMTTTRGWGRSSSSKDVTSSVSEESSSAASSK
jgi:Pet100